MLVNMQKPIFSISSQTRVVSSFAVIISSFECRFEGSNGEIGSRVPATA
jgi:hypothetical protein